MRIFKNNRLELLLVIATFISLFIIKLFPFYLTGQESKLLSSHTFAKVIISIVALICILISLFATTVRKKKIKNNTVFRTIATCYLLIITFSVIVAVDIPSYLRQLQNVIVNCLYFYVAYTLISQKKYDKLFFHYLITIGILCIVIDLVFLVFKDTFIEVIKDSTQIEIIALLYHNAAMGRYNSYLVLDAFIPVFFLVYSTSIKDKKNLFILIITVGITIFISYITLFRTRFIQSIFAFFFSLVIGFHNKIKDFLILLIFISILFFYMFLIMKFTLSPSTNVIDRLFLSQQEDVETVNYRFESLDRAIEMVSSSPLLGIGLGNYKAYVNKTLNRGITDRNNRIHLNETLDNPHSIFIEVLSETGILGFCIFIGLLIYFCLEDFIYIRHSWNTPTSYYIIFAWTIFLYGIFNPFNTVYLSGWFWFMRGYIQNKYNFKK